MTNPRNYGDYLRQLLRDPREMAAYLDAHLEGATVDADLLLAVRLCIEVLEAK